MPKAIDIRGVRSGQLVAIRPSGKNSNHGVIWLCQCDCGKFHFVRSSAIQKGEIRSCGCKAGTYQHGHTKNGRLPLAYKSWLQMRSRCNSETNPKYKYYGGRGIIVCARWDSFENFLADMGPRPDGYSIERINVDGNYEPSNCKWIPKGEQSRNRRGVRSVTHSL